MSFESLIQSAKFLQQKNSPHLSDKKIPSCILISDSKKNPALLEMIPSLSVEVMIMIRNYDHQDRSHYIEEVSSLCRKYQLKFIIALNDIKNISLTNNAYGFHLPERLISWSEKIKLLYPDCIISCAVHNKESIELANGYPIDMVLLSPIFITDSHPNKAHLGIENFNNLAILSQKPVYALGGITSQNHKLLIKSKASGIAGISIFK